MDLSLLSTRQRSEAGAVLNVTDPRTGDPLLDESGQPVTITLTGVDGDRYREHQREVQNRRLKSLARGGKVRLDIDADSLEQDGLALLAKCTLAWQNVSWKGEPLECSFENAKMLYGELPWLRDQVDEFIGTRQNFFPTPPSNS